MARKKVTKKVNSTTTKTTSKKDSDSFKSYFPIWDFSMCDNDGPFCFNHGTVNHSLIVSNILDFSKMTWQQIDQQTHDKNKSSNHYILPDKMTKEGKERLSKLCLEEHSESIYSLRLQNLIRVIGIRYNRTFRIIWYDKNHGFSKVTK